MKQGTQIAYVPLEAGGNLAFVGVEMGFVVKERGNAHFCRYWRAGHPGKLRTTANSELTPNELLVEHQSVEQSIVEDCLVHLGYKEKK